MQTQTSRVKLMETPTTNFLSSLLYFLTVFISQQHAGVSATGLWTYFHFFIFLFSFFNDIDVNTRHYKASTRTCSGTLLAMPCRKILGHSRRRFLLFVLLLIGPYFCVFGLNQCYLFFSILHRKSRMYISLTVIAS